MLGLGARYLNPIPRVSLTTHGAPKQSAPSSARPPRPRFGRDGRSAVCDVLRMILAPYLMKTLVLALLCLSAVPALGESESSSEIEIIINGTRPARNLRCLAANLFAAAPATGGHSTRPASVQCCAFPKALRTAVD